MVYRYKKAPSQRQLRVAENIKHALSDIFIRNELSLPLFDKVFVTISEVRISPDLKNATAFVASIDNLDIKELIKYLNEFSPHFRRLLSKSVELKSTPEIRFAYDKSFDEGAKIEAIFHKLD